MKKLILLLLFLGLCNGCANKSADIQTPLSRLPPKRSIVAQAQATSTETIISTPTAAPITPTPVTIASVPLTATWIQSTTAILYLLDSASNPTELASTGAQIYLSQYCGVCHTLASLKTTGTFGPNHNRIGITATQRIQDSAYHGIATREAAYLLESIVDPQSYIVPGYELSAHRMPSYRHLAEGDLAALVQFLLLEK